MQMGDDETFTLCRLCGKRVEPSDEGVHYAVALLDVPGFGQADDFVEGMGGFFHEYCAVPSGWRAKPKP
jgi:hypothetical protein